LLTIFCQLFHILSKTLDSTMLFRVAVLLSATLGLSMAACPIGMYEGTSFLSPPGRIAVGGCEGRLGADCPPANCNPAMIVIAQDAPDAFCEVTVQGDGCEGGASDENPITLGYECEAEESGSKTVRLLVAHWGGVRTLVSYAVKLTISLYA